MAVSSDIHSFGFIVHVARQGPSFLQMEFIPSQSSSILLDTEISTTSIPIEAYNGQCNALPTSSDCFLSLLTEESHTPDEELCHIYHC